jgi:DNA mismatch endonuclease (patch repair protein)
VFPRYRAAVFVHGCFWHRHEGCRFTTNPSTNSQFWARKFDENVARDRRNLDLLAEAGWRTAIVWECALKAEGAEAIAQRVFRWLKSGDTQLRLG